MKILVLNGPNINMLGVREPDKYGSLTLDDINKEMHEYSFELGLTLEVYQSNNEGELVDKIQQAYQNFDGIIINPAAYTHTSIAIRDAILAVGIPAIEIHLSNVHAREDFRQKSFIAPVCIGQIAGFKKDSYILALKAISEYLKQKN